MEWEKESNASEISSPVNQSIDQDLNGIWLAYSSVGMVYNMYTYIYVYMRICIYICIYIYMIRQYVACMYFMAHPSMWLSRVSKKGRVGVVLQRVY